MRVLKDRTCSLCGNKFDAVIEDNGNIDKDRYWYGGKIKVPVKGTGRWRKSKRRTKFTIALPDERRGEINYRHTKIWTGKYKMVEDWECTNCVKHWVSKGMGLG